MKNGILTASGSGVAGARVVAVIGRPIDLEVGFVVSTEAP